MSEDDILTQYNETQITMLEMVRAVPIAAEVASALPLPPEAQPSIRLLARSIAYSERTGEPLLLVSTVCPPYDTTDDGTPTYSGLGNGISPIIAVHLNSIPQALEILQRYQIPALHFLLMADTEVDLSLFLDRRLRISPEIFRQRCDESIEQIRVQMAERYSPIQYEETGIPYAGTFLGFFGKEAWYQRYQYFLNLLVTAFYQETEGAFALKVRQDKQERSRIITALLGEDSTEEAQLQHILRQKAQYMAFASLMRERFGVRRVVVFNHMTPNFSYMNNGLVRLPADEYLRRNRSLHPRLPLVRLNISTLPR